MADQAARGKKALEDKRYPDAIAEYTAALNISPTSPDYLIQRSTAYHRNQDHASALVDASNAVLNAQKRAKRELIVEAQFRRGCALYSLERYGDAEFVLGVVKRMDEKHKMVAMWLQKTIMALKKLDDDDEKRKCNVKETPGSDESKGGMANGSSASANGADSAPISQSPATPAQPQQTPVDKIRHEWYQNSDHVYFTLLAKGVPKDKAQVDVKETSLTISFPLVTGSTYDLTLEPLFGKVNQEKSIIRVLPTKIEIILAKATSGQKWSALESNEPITSKSGDSAPADAAHGQDELAKNAALSSNSSAPSYPTSSKSGPKDWDKIVKDVRRAENPDKADEGMDDDDDFEDGDEANKFFKKLFKGASPDVQKAMMKSYTESNGTALSTNWEEVSKGKVETQPPDGMEAKKWEK